MRFTVFCFFAVMLSASTIFAQSDTSATFRQIRRERAEEAINNLKKGALIVRLPSNRLKIQALEELVAQNGKEADRAQRLLDKTKKEARESQLALMEAFQKHYHFSKVYWMHDSAMTQLSAGATRGFLLNDQLEVDPNLSLPGSSWLMLRFGYTDPATTTRVEAMIIADQQNEDLTAPFPWAHRLNRRSFVVDIFLDPQAAHYRNFQKIVKDMEKQLQRYYKHNLD